MLYPNYYCGAPRVMPEPEHIHALALVVPFEQLRMADVERVGGKNASLGEMISQLSGVGIRVPGGFATTAAAYREFLQTRRLGRPHCHPPGVARHRRRGGSWRAPGRKFVDGWSRRRCLRRSKPKSTSPTRS